MKYVILFFALFSFNAYSMDWELGIGSNTFRTPPNGLYYQEHTRDTVPYRFDLTTTAFSFGASDYITRGTSYAWYDRGHDGIRWRVEYLDNGTVNSVAKGTSDVNYDPVNRTCVSKPCALGTFATWTVDSRHRGLVTSVAPEWSVGPGKLFIEAGVYWGFPEITVRIDRADGSRDTYKYQGGMNAGPVFGAGYQYKKLQIVVRYIQMDAVNHEKGVFERDLPPNHEPSVFQVMGRYQF